MSYSDFLNSLISPISSFFDWFLAISNNLLQNYFFITLLGIPLFISILFLIYNLLTSFYFNEKKYDEYNDKTFKNNIKNK